MVTKRTIILICIFVFLYTIYAFEYTNNVFKLEKISDEYARTIINGYYNTDVSGVEIFDDNSVTLGNLSLAKHTYRIFIKDRILDTETALPSYVQGATLDPLDALEVDSRPLYRNGIFYFVVESKYGMAAWKNLTFYFNIFLHQNHAPLNPFVKYQVDPSDPNKPYYGLDPDMSWDEVPSSVTDGNYAPYQVPLEAAACSTWDPSMGDFDGGGVTSIVGKAGWNLRLWFYPSNVFDKVAGINFAQEFASDLVINKFTGNTTNITPFTQETIKVINPTITSADHPSIPSALLPMSLIPNDTKGVVPDISTTLGTGDDTREVSIDLTPYNLYGRYLVVICQLWAYDRYQITSTDFPLNLYRTALIDQELGVGLVNSAYFNVPNYYKHIWDFLSANTLQTGKPAPPVFEVPPLSTAMHLKKFKLNYNIMNFDVFLDRNSPGAGKLSLDHITKYYQWRSIQNFYNGKFENGYVERDQ